MADPAPQNLAAPALSSLGLYWTGTGWSAVMSNPYFQTNYMFYQSPLRGAAGPAEQIASDLTSLGINYQVIDQVPEGAVNRLQAFQYGITPSDAVTPRNTGIINNYNGPFAEEAAAVDSITTAQGFFVENQRFLPTNGVGVNTQVDGIAVNQSWWSGTTNTQIEVTLGTKSSGLNNAIVDSLYMPVEAGIAERMGLIGQLSTDGGSVLVPMGDVAASNLAYGAGELMRFAGITAFGVGTAWDLYNGYQAYQAGGAQFAYWLGTSGPTYAGMAGGAGYAAFTGATLPEIVSAGAAGALPGLLIGGAVLNFQMYMNLYATDPQQAVALTYAQAEMIDAAAGVYDPNSPYYVPPNPTWQAPAFQPGPWPGDPVQSNSFWGTVQSIGSYIANSIITPAGETPPYTGPVNGDLPPVPYVAETLGVQQILAGQTPDPFIFGGQPVPYLAETQSFQQIMAGQDPSTFGFGAQPVPYVAETLAVQGALSAGAGGGAPSVFDTGTSAVPYV